MVKTTVLGAMPDGTPVHVFEIAGERARVRLMDLGASLFGMDVPDRDGGLADVVLGYDDVESYLASGACFGATVGPSANRSGNAEVLVGERVYHLPGNDGPNHAINLHTDLDHGLHKRVWEAEVLEGQAAVRFSIQVADGEYGLPGNRVFSATYRLVEGADGSAELALEYRCKTDEPTFVNMTNHSYFNLAGHGAGTALGHEVQIAAAHYLPLSEDCVSRGDVAEVAGTPFDFREAKLVGRDITAADEQLRIAHGYDHCFCVDGYDAGEAASGADAEPRPGLLAYEPKSGRKLRICVSTPGAHFYTANWFDNDQGKDGAVYQARDAFAFEPEFYPDNSHHADWPHSVCEPGRPFESKVSWRFSVR